MGWEVQLGKQEPREVACPATCPPRLCPPCMACARGWLPVGLPRGSWRPGDRAVPITTLSLNSQGVHGSTPGVPLFTANDQRRPRGLPARTHLIQVQGRGGFPEESGKPPSHPGEGVAGLGDLEAMSLSGGRP